MSCNLEGGLVKTRAGLDWKLLYYTGLYGGYIGTMENKMETAMILFLRLLDHKVFLTGENALNILA